MILIQKVANYNEIQAMADPNAMLNIYELIENTEHERIFDPCDIEKPGWLDKLFGKDLLPSHYYIASASFPVVMEKDVSHQDTHGPLGLTLELEVKLDMVRSDSGKGLADWLENRNVIEDKILKAFVQNKLTDGFLENTLGLKNKPFNELAGGTLRYGADVFRNVLPHWLVVERCRVSNAVVKMTQSEVMREQHARRLAEIDRQLAERLAEQDKEKALLEADIEKQKLANELAKLKAEGDGIVNQKRMAMLQTVSASIHGNQRSNAIAGEPFIAERLVVEINDVRLELESKRNVVVGRVTPNSDVSVQIPKGCKGEDLNGCISRVHARLEHLGETVRIKNLCRTPRTYVNGKEVPEDGKTFAENVELGFSYDVRWKCRVQKRMNDAGVETISSLVMNYPACDDLYKIFVWPGCQLKAVDPRLPNWRIAYQNGAHGSEGAFYVTTSDGRSVYLNQQLSVIEDVAVTFVED